ncbi:hypothetical protein CRG98_026451 [Punica granatum]|uniref:Uncharacterized protein n=1 Tax=Punica granatum TaxID=22663 RepID=A0A2I0JBW3_PUNGR|nr:hypothetical protein CRG98_026451 [Punica granatum]
MPHRFSGARVSMLPALVVSMIRGSLILFYLNLYPFDKYIFLLHRPLNIDLWSFVDVRLSIDLEYFTSCPRPRTLNLKSSTLGPQVLNLRPLTSRCPSTSRRPSNSGPRTHVILDLTLSVDLESST